MSGGGFGRRGQGILVTVIGLSFIGGLILSVFGDRFGNESAGADGQSVSAIGHHLFVEYLRERGWTVEKSRTRTAARLRDDSLLVLAEPRLDADDEEGARRLVEMIENAGSTLLVLGKREGLPDSERRYLRQAVSLRPEVILRPLEALGITAELTHPLRSSEAPEWSIVLLGHRPRIDDLQLLRSSEIEPIVATEEGILLGRVLDLRFPNLYVLSDPDPIATHGLVDPDNALFVEAALREAARGDVRVVVDETCHGLEVPETFWEALLSFPLVLILLTLALVVAAALWANAGAWGTLRPLDFGRRRGKHELLDNTAELLAHGGHDRLAIKRQLAFARQDVARALHAPRQLDRARRRAWLENAARSRGLLDELEALEAETVPRAGARDSMRRDNLALARRIHDWKEKMIHGPR
ncbi:MAG: hypothetical protein R3E53_00040 [Myxococcota bacterium]